VLQAIDDGKQKIQPAGDAEALAGNVLLQERNQPGFDGGLVDGRHEAEGAVTNLEGSVGFLEPAKDGVGGSQIDGLGAHPALAGAAGFAVGGGIDFFPPGGLVVIVDGSVNGFGINASGHERPSPNSNITFRIIYL